MNYLREVEKYSKKLKIDVKNYRASLTAIIKNMMNIYEQSGASLEDKKKYFEMLTEAYESLPVGE